MYCKSYKATISVRCCIKRQDLALKIKMNNNGNSHELDDDEEESGNKKIEYKLGTFKRCLECTTGLKIKENPFYWKLDLDVKKLMRQYYPKPERFHLNRLKVFPKLELERMDQKEQRRRKAIYD